MNIYILTSLIFIKFFNTLLTRQFIHVYKITQSSRVNNKCTKNKYGKRPKALS